jgi:8-oxo-dGTP pyrophosphatase MutT (NUDIX family)
LRELTEELGIQLSSIDAFGVIGYGRFIDRGGKPEFFCVARLSANRSEIRVSKPEKKFMQSSEFYELEKTIPIGPSLQQAAKYFLDNHEPELSNSLFWNLKVLAMADSSKLTEILEAI